MTQLGSWLLTGGPGFTVQTHTHARTHAHVHTDGLDDKICFLSYNIHQKVQ